MTPFRDSDPPRHSVTPSAARYSGWEMQAVMIVVCAVLGAIGYGVIHDQITVRVCLEYFSIGHPPVFGTTSPTLLGLGWGVLATWWVGLPLGIALAIAARAGSRPKRTARSLTRPMGLLLVAMAVCALGAGVAGNLLARRGYIFLWEPLFSAVPQSKHVRFLADAWAHTASYFSGILGGCVLVVWTWLAREPTIIYCGLYLDWRRPLFRKR